MSDDEYSAALVGLSKILVPSESSSSTLKQYVIENRVYKNVSLNLDGYSFKNCAFIGCELQVAKGNFFVTSCHFSRCTLQVTGNSRRVIKLFSMFPPVDASAYRANVTPDGGVTIL